MKKILGVTALLALAPVAEASYTGSDAVKAFSFFVGAGVSLDVLNINPFAQELDITNSIAYKGIQESTADVTHNLKVLSPDNKAFFSGTVGAFIKAGMEYRLTDKLAIGGEVLFRSHFFTKERNTSKLNFETTVGGEEGQYTANEVSKEKKMTKLNVQSTNGVAYVFVNGEKIIANAVEGGENAFTTDIKQLKATTEDKYKGMGQTLVNKALYNYMLNNLLSPALTADQKKSNIEYINKNAPSLANATELAKLFDTKINNTNNDLIVQASTGTTVNSVKLLIGSNVNGPIFGGSVNGAAFNRDLGIIDAVDNSFSIGDLTLNAVGVATTGTSLSAIFKAGAAKKDANFITFKSTDTNGLDKDGKGIVTDYSKFADTFLGGKDSSLKSIAGVKMKDKASLNRLGGEGMMTANFIDLSLFDIQEQGVKLTDSDAAALGLEVNKDKAYYLVFNEKGESAVYLNGNCLLVGKNVNLNDFGANSAFRTANYTSEQNLEITKIKKRALFSTDVNGFVKYNLTPKIAMKLGVGGSYEYNKSVMDLKYTNTGSASVSELSGGDVVSTNNYSTADLTKDQFNFAFSTEGKDTKESANSGDSLTITNPSTKSTAQLTMGGFNHALGANGVLGMELNVAQGIALTFEVVNYFLYNFKTKYKNSKKDDVDYGIKGSDIANAKNKAYKMVVQLGASAKF